MHMRATGMAGLGEWRWVGTTTEGFLKEEVFKARRREHTPGEEVWAETEGLRAGGQKGCCDVH